VGPTVNANSPYSTRSTFAATPLRISPEVMRAPADKAPLVQRLINGPGMMERSMIVRIWRGGPRPEDTEAYASYVEEIGLAAYRTTPGCQGAFLASRRDGDKTEFLTVSFWDSEESIRQFARDGGLLSGG